MEDLFLTLTRTRMHKQLLFVGGMLIIILLMNCGEKKQPVVKSHVLLSLHARPLTNIKFDPSTERLQRGGYLVNGILRCFTCHSPHDSTQAGWPPVEAQKGGGSVYFRRDSFYMIAPNISPDPETGAGKWSDDMFVRAIREGIGHDGRALEYMPFWTFASLSDEDLASVIVYMRSIPAVKNQLPPRYMSEKFEKSAQDEPRQRIEAVPQPDLSTNLAKGRYLITIGECEGCHTGWYDRNPGFFGGGNIIHISKNDSVCSPNLTPDLTGVGGWNDAVFSSVMKTGKSGHLNRIMPWIAFRNISDSDLSCMLTALKSLPPVNHQILNSLEPTYCEVCGRRHGYGKFNRILSLKAYPEANPREYPGYSGRFINKYGDTTIIHLQEKRLWINTNKGESELIPVSAGLFQASGYPGPVHFIEDKKGKVNSLLVYDMINDTSLRVR
jgi:Cytochrome C oxidase, cbb3-type, subunit III